MTIQKVTLVGGPSLSFSPDLSGEAVLEYGGKQMVVKFEDLYALIKMANSHSKVARGHVREQAEQRLNALPFAKSAVLFAIEEARGKALAETTERSPQVLKLMEKMFTVALNSVIGAR